MKFVTLVHSAQTLLVTLMTVVHPVSARIEPKHVMLTQVPVWTVGQVRSETTANSVRRTFKVPTVSDVNPITMALELTSSMEVVQVSLLPYS